MIHIKPLFGGVLNLLSGRLKKDYGLTQEVMELFVTYRIPGGLFYYDRVLLSSIVETISSGIDEPQMVYHCTGAADGFDFLVRTCLEYLTE